MRRHKRYALSLFICLSLIGCSNGNGSENYLDKEEYYNQQINRVQSEKDRICSLTVSLFTQLEIRECIEWARLCAPNAEYKRLLDMCKKEDRL